MMEFISCHNFFPDFSSSSAVKQNNHGRCAPRHLHTIEIVSIVNTSIYYKNRKS